MSYSLKDRTAVITGASAGIGEALATEFAARGCNLHLVARRREKLEQLARQLSEKYGIQTWIHAMDLSQPEAAAQLAAGLRQQPVTVVVNNAGIGMTGPFHTQDAGVIATMLNLNIRFLTEFCHIMVPVLKASGDTCRILNVGSVAGYQGVHNFMPYAATKAYVNNLSEGLNWELHGSNITVTCLQPGSTRSEFFDNAAMEGSFMATYDVMTSGAVARAGVTAMMAGKAFIVPGITNKIKIFSLRFTPRALLRRVIYWMFRDLAREH